MIGGHKRLAHIRCWLQIPGSHRQGQLTHQLTSDNANQLSKGQTVRVASGTERSAVELVLRPGQASLHHEKLVHASGPEYHMLSNETVCGNCEVSQKATQQHNDAV